MPHNSHNHKPVPFELVRPLGRIGNIDAFAESKLAGPKLARENFVNHRDVLVGRIVRLCEVAALDELRADGIEVARQNRAHICHDGVLLVRGSAVLPVVVIPVACVIQRKMGNGRNRLHAGKCCQRALHLAQSIVIRHAHPQSKDIFRPEAGIYAENVREGANQQACSR